MIQIWLFRWSRPSRQKPSNGRARKKFASGNLWLETLEDRTVPSVTLGVSVDGMNTSNNSCNCQPPDTIAAAGPNHVIELVNTALEVFNKDGTVASAPQSLASFFSSVFVGPNQTDPFVMYDETLGRFAVGIMDYVNLSTPNHLDFAVSSADNGSPLTWTFENYSVGEGSFFADYPRAGWNAEAYFVGFNMFNTTGTGSFSHVQELVINKSTLAISSQNDLSTSLFTVTPAVMHGAVATGADPEYFVEASNGGGSTIHVLTMTNVLAAAPTITDTTISVPAYAIAPAPSQPGHRSIARFDARIFNAAWRDNHLVAAHQVGVSSGGHHGKTAGVARWYDFDTSGSSPVLFQSGNQAGVTNGATAFMPSVDINAADSIGLNFNESSKTEFWSMYVTGRTTAMALGTMQSPVRAVAGTAISPDSRVGDFSAITVDPSDGLTFWAANQYQGSDFWDTHIASFTVTGTSIITPINIVATLPDSGAAQPESQTVTPSQVDSSVGEANTAGQIIAPQTETQTDNVVRVSATRTLDSFWADPANLDFVGLPS
jgi:hypothetical protein